MTPEVIIGIAGTVTAVVTSITAYINNRHKKRLNVKLIEKEKELEVHRDTFDVTTFLQKWDSFYWDLQKLMHDTSLDRFLILRAWNGVLSPKYTTAVLQIRQGAQEPTSYVHVELDTDYVDKLMIVRQKGYYYFLVDELPDSLIKTIYLAERVTASFWYYIDYKQFAENTRITYCSFATHNPKGFSTEEITKMRLIGDRLKGVTGL